MVNQPEGHMQAQLYIHNLPAPPSADKETQARIKCLNKLEELIASVEKTGTFSPVRKGQFTKLINTARKNGLQDLAAEIEQLKTRFADMPKAALRQAIAEDRSNKRRREGDESDIDEAAAPEALIEPEDALDAQPMAVVSDIKETYQQQLRERAYSLNMRRNAPEQRVARVVENLKERVESQGRRFVQAKRTMGNMVHEHKRSCIVLTTAVLNAIMDTPAYISAGAAAGPLGVLGAAGYTAYKTAMATTGLLFTVAAWDRLAPQNPQQEGDQEPQAA